MKTSLLEKGSIRSNDYTENNQYKQSNNIDIKDIIISEEEII